MPTNMTRVGSPSPLESKKQTWVQTERSTHEAWADLVRLNGTAASLLHTLVAHIDSQAAVVVSRATLAEIQKCSPATIKRAVAVLKEGAWIEAVQIGGKGGVDAYVINSRWAWADKRERRPGAMFTATVLASTAEQEKIETVPLRRIAALASGPVVVLQLGHRRDHRARP